MNKARIARNKHGARERCWREPYLGDRARDLGHNCATSSHPQWITCFGGRGCAADAHAAERGMWVRLILVLDPLQPHRLPGRPAGRARIANPTTGQL
jgi:hypothetical protein